MYGWSINVAPKMPTSEALAASTKTGDTASAGLIAGTMVASAQGWQPVETLKVGDRVHTFDNGMQPIIDIKRRVLWEKEADRETQPWPVVIPEDALGNSHEMIFLPDQGVMLESENACDRMGDPYAIMPAQVLEGLCGIESAPAGHAMELVSLVFAAEEVVYIDGSMLVYCPQQPSALEGFDVPAPVYDVKSLDEAQDMLTDLDLAELALRETENEDFGPPGLERIA